MVGDIIISNKNSLEKIKKKILEEGKEKFHVIADFDRTLTKAFVEGQKTPTVIAQVRNGNYLTKDYAPKAHTLFDKYHPIEIDTNIDDKEKNEKMHEWWMKHFELLVECGFNKKVIKEIVAKGGIEFREGALKLIDILHEKNIPLVIMSAGPGDMIIEYLKKEGRLYDNVHVVANFYDFNEKGIAVKVREPIIHSVNKHETEVKGLPIYEDLVKRKNVLLLGDGLGDLGMIEGFPYENVIKIGFLNYNIEESLDKFKENFDVVITNDESMEYITKLLKEVLK